MKLLFGLSQALLVFLLTSAPARAEPEGTREYVLAVTRVATYMSVQGMADDACRERFPGDYNVQSFETWKKRNTRVVAEVEKHLNALPHFLSSLYGTDIRKEEQQIDAWMLERAMGLVNTINDPNPVVGKRVCSLVSESLAREDSDLKIKHAKDLGILRACKKKKVCTHMMAI